MSDVGAPEETRPETSHAYSARWQWLMTICLTLLLVLAQVDKTIISLLIEPIKQDIGLSDFQISLVLGAAFALANIAATLPAGWLADRFNRQAVIQVGVGIWSAMTMACGAAWSFGSLFAARAGVGFGEGLLPTPAFSLIRDGVEASRRGRAFAMFSSANSLGAGISLLIGGGLITAAYNSGVTHLPLFGAVEPWQVTLIIVGVAGFPLSALIWVFPKPARTAVDDARSISIAAAWREVTRNRRVYLPLLGYSVAHASIASTFGLWIPAFTARHLGLTPIEIALTLGVLLVCVAPLGVLSIGVLIDRLSATSLRPIAALTCCIAIAAALMAATLPFTDHLVAFWCLQGGSILMSTGYLAITTTVITRTSPPRVLGKVLSVFLLMQALVGAGVAPACVGLLSDTVFANGHFPLAQALATVAGSCGAVAVLSALLLLRAAGRRDRESKDPTYLSPAASARI